MPRQVMDPVKESNLPALANGSVHFAFPWSHFLLTHFMHQLYRSSEYTAVCVHAVHTVTTITTLMIEKISVKFAMCGNTMHRI